ncbi:hypothetical protein A2U01_0105852, partial [Trifolium medium]|nr:hypothetical protein [Trifolium medium]
MCPLAASSRNFRKFSQSEAALGIVSFASMIGSPCVRILAHTDVLKPGRR